MKEERENSAGSADTSAIKLFGKTIAVNSGVSDSQETSTKAGTSADAAVVHPCASQAGSEEVDGASTQSEADEMGSSTCNEIRNVEAPKDAPQESQVSSEKLASETMTVSTSIQAPAAAVAQEKQRPLTVEEKKEQCVRKPDKLIPCPRCDSLDTKFCYYNNYNINQPRHFCKSCQRYWTAGGTLRNVLVGAGRRKNKYGSSQMKQEASEGVNSGITTVRLDHHEGAQPMLPCAINPYGLKVPPMNIPQLAASCASRQASEAQSTVTSCGKESNKVFTSASAFKPAGPDVSNDSVSKLRQRTRTDTPEGKDVSSPGSSPFVSESPTSHVLTSRVQPQQQEVQQQAMWTKSNPQLGFFNGAWPYGYSIGWSGAGPIHGTPAMCSPHPASSGTTSPPSGMCPTPGNVWTGLWASGMPGMPQGMASMSGMSGVSAMPFGWNMCPGGWTLPWRPVPAVAVQGSADVVVVNSGGFRKRDGANDEGVRKMARIGSPEEVVV